MSTKLGPLIILFTSLTLTLIWFHKELMFAGGEEGLLFYNPQKYLELISHTWYDANGGYPVVLHLPRVPYFWVVTWLFHWGMTSPLLQALTFFLLILTGSLSVYYVVRETVGENLSAPIIASLFYLFNPYSMSQIWGRGIFAQFFAFALIPLFLFLFVRGLNKKNLGYIALMSLASFVFSAAYVVVTNALVVWVPTMIYLIYYLVTNRREKRSLSFALFYTFFGIVVWILTNFWWILPTAKTASSAYFHFLTGTNNLDSLIGMSRMYLRPIWVIRLLQGSIFLQSQVLSWLIPAIAVLSLPLLKKAKEIWFWVALWIVGFSISIGANPPTGGIFVWLFTKFSFLQAFRNPYEKAGLLLMLPYAILFTVGWSWLFRKSRIVAITVIVGVCGVLVWPLWTGKFNSAWVRVPDYYQKADTWLVAQPGNFKIIQMPLINGDGVRYDWQHTYQGIEPGEFLFTPSSIGRNVAFNKVYYNVLLQRFGNFAPLAFGPDPDISRSEFRSSKLWEELIKLEVRYIVFHNDFDESFMKMKAEDFKQILVGEEKIKYIKTFDKLDIYEVEIPEGVNRIYSPDAQVSFKKINPTHYKFEVENSVKPIKLYFLEMYDPGWEAFVEREKIESHFTVFSYANGWSIDKNGTYRGEIKYKPQEYVKEGSRVSIITGIGLIIITTILILKRRLGK